MILFSIFLSSPGPLAALLRNTYKNKLSKFLQIYKAPAEGSMPDHHYSLDHSPSLPSLVRNNTLEDNLGTWTTCVISLSRILIAMTRSVMICRHCVDTTPNHLPHPQHPLVIISQLVSMTPLSIPLPNMFPLLNMSPLPNMFTYNIGLSINQLL